MNLLNKKNSLLTVVNNEDLYFVRSNSDGKFEIVHRLSLDQILSTDDGSIPISDQVFGGRNELLIIPDYWIGHTAYQFQSTKRSLVEAFIERKIKTENPTLAGVEHFLEYQFYQRDRDDRGILVYYLKEQNAFQLYQKLEKLQLMPVRITSPAFLWKKKIKKRVPDFDSGGQCLICIMGKECTIFLYFQNQFLFSRNISLQGADIESSEVFNSLNFEINQSLHLFSQKTKSDINRIYMLSTIKESAKTLSEILGKEIKELGILDRAHLDNRTQSSQLGTIGYLSPDDLSLKHNYLCLSHKRLKQELEWKPIQTAGIIVGLVLFLLLGIEGGYLLKWSRGNQQPVAFVALSEDMEAGEVLQQYTEAVEMIQREKERISPGHAIRNIALSLPENTRIEELVVDAEQSPGVAVKGIIQAYDLNQFKASLSTLIGELNRNIPGNRTLGLSDIDVQVDSAKAENGSQSFRFQLMIDMS